MLPKNKNEWNDYSTVPKDGRLVVVAYAFDDSDDIQESYVMRWGHIQKNALKPEITGMWVDEGRNFTWMDDRRDGAPTHWLPHEEQQNAA